MSSIPPSDTDLLSEVCGLPEAARWSRLSQCADRERALQELVEASARLTMIDAARAIDATAVVVALADQSGSNLLRARARRARARALSYKGRCEEALAVCYEAADLAERCGRLDEAGRARLASMHALTETGRFGEALASGEAARQAFTQIDEPALVARADINLGVVHQRRDEPASALTCFDRARPHVSDDPLTLGHLDNNRGEALLALNDFPGAERAFSAALDAFEDADASLTAAIAEGNLADLAVRQGRLARALDFFERARRHLEAAESPGHLARLLAEQADGKALLGLTDDALREYAEALPELDRCGLALEAARARSGMGLAQFRAGRYAEAETALAAAATGFDDLGHATARARVDLTRAELAAANGRSDEARRMALRALSVLEARPAEATLARHLLARLALEHGDLPLAAAELAGGLAVAEKLDLAPLRADLLHTRGRMHLRQRRPEQAVRSLRLAVEQVERVRGTLQAERFRTAYLGDRTAIYEDLFRAILDQGGRGAVEQAFAVAEKCKSRALLDVLGGAIDVDVMTAQETDDPSEAALFAELADVRSELNALYSRLADEALSTQGAGASDLWRQAVRQREARLESVEQRLASSCSRPGFDLPPIDLATAQRAVPRDGVMIEYFAIGEEVVAFSISSRRATVFRGLAHVAEIARSIEALQFQIDRALRPGAMEGSRADRLTDAARRELASLYDRLVGPMRRQLEGVSSLTIIPHGLLHVIPFHALYDGSFHLIQTHEIHSAPSASLLSYLSTDHNQSRAGAGAAVIGVADAHAPEIETEARLVAEMLRCPQDRVLVGAEATTERFERVSRDAALLHLASHGHFSPENPLGSGVKLHDRWLTARDLFALRLRADLVTLSGCETGLNLVSAGDELQGLLRGFFAAGARSLLVSLWRVNDTTTLEFMRAFYRLWYSDADAGVTRAGALRAAQLRMLEHHPHPAFWAAFFLAGAR